MVRANVVDILRREDTYIIMLRDEQYGRVLPIWVGKPEGEAIASGLLDIPVTRPQTFDFMAHMLDTFGAQLEEARVDVLKDEVFYGTAKFRIGNEVKEVDARPSDVIALAVRTNSPIFVTEEVIQRAGKERSTFQEELRQQAKGEDTTSILKEWRDRLKQRQAGVTQDEEKAE